ncbi:MAG: tetratricopeptide repeat protein [Candidatus Latescibacteria bacterium]|nr:tetratricopeptide repeat protein [Candidatus Latescibacterota bacterium]
MMNHNVKLVLVFIFNVIFYITASAQTVSEESKSQAKQHFSFAVQNKKSKNYEEAEKQYEKSLALDASVYQVYYSYADMLMTMGKELEARRRFLQAFNLNPEHYSSAAMLAKLYYQESVFDSALVMYECMYELKPEKSEFLSVITGIKEYLGMEEEALASYDKLFETGTGTFEHKIRAAKIALNLGNTERANSYVESALGDNPDDVNALKIAASTRLDMGDTQGAINHYRKLAESEAANITVVETLENLYRDQSDENGLLWALERHHELASENVEVLGELAKMLYSEGLMDQSIAYVKKGIKIDPKDGRLRILMGEHFRTNGDNEKALAEFRIALNDERYKSSAQSLIYQIEKPETAEEKAEKDFFSRGN